MKINMNQLGLSKTEKAEHERKSLPNSRGDLRGARIAQTCREQSAQNPAAVHWKCRQQVKKKQHDIHRE